MRIRLKNFVPVALLAAAGFYLVNVRKVPHVEFDDQELKISLDKIQVWMKGHAPELASGLEAGLAKSGVEDLARRRGIAVPEEVYALYNWHNGQAADLPFFDEYRFLPAGEAFDYGDAFQKAHLGRPYELPLFRSTVTSAVFTVTCMPSPTDVAPIQFAYRETTQEGDSLTSFMKALSKSFELGVFEYTAGHAIRTKRPLMQRVFLEILPDRQKAINKILEGNPQQVTPDQEMAGYQDLLAVEDPGVEKMVLVAAERWSFDDEYSFTTMQYLADLHTKAAFDELQKLMRHSNPAVRKRAAAMVAFWWPADGRKLDPETEAAGIDDLIKGSFDNLDRRLVLRALARSSGSPQVVSAVLLSLNNPEKDTRMAAAQTLGLLGDKRAIGPLQARMAAEVDKGVRDACYRAISDLGGGLGETQARL